MNNQDLAKEEALLLNAQTNKEDFDHLYKYFVNDVYRFSYSILNNQHDAEDITSQVFIELYKKIDSFEWKGISLKSWLFKVAKNLSYKKFSKLSLQEFDEESTVPEDYEVSFVDEIMNKDLLDKVQQEIQNLKPIERETINLRIWEGMSYTEIAQIQSSLESTVRMRFNRSIQKVRSALESKNIRSLVALPILFTAIKQAGTVSAYCAPKSLASLSLGSLLLTKTTMSTGLLTSIKSLLASKAGVAVIAGTVAVTGATTGYIYEKNQEKKELGKTVQITPTPTLEVPVPTTSITSTPTITSIPKGTVNTNTRKTYIETYPISYQYEYTSNFNPIARDENTVNNVVDFVLGGSLEENRAFVKMWDIKQDSLNRGLKSFMEREGYTQLDEIVVLEFFGHPCYSTEYLKTNIKQEAINGKIFKKISWKGNCTYPGGNKSNVNSTVYVTNFENGRYYNFITSYSTDLNSDTYNDLARIIAETIKLK